MKKLVYFSLIFCACSSQETETNNTSENEISENPSGTMPENPEEIEEAQSEANLKTFIGTIGETPIYLEYSFNKNEAEGFYYYTANQIRFELEGTVEEDRVELNRMKDGVIREIFTFSAKSGSGKWTKSNQTKKLMLTEINSLYEGSFLYLAQWVADKNSSIVDYSSISKLSLKDDKIVAPKFYSHKFNNTKILLHDSYENNAGGFDAQMSFFNIAKENYIALIHAEIINHYEYMEDDLGEGNEHYSISVQVVSTEAGEDSIDQTIEMNGEGMASIDLINNQVIIYREGTTDIFFFDQFKLIEK